jgi:hypothetical protein
VFAGFYAIDIFLFLSGFLAGYLIISMVKKMKPSVLNYLKFLLHRFFRIWPAYFIAIFLFPENPPNPWKWTYVLAVYNTSESMRYDILA